MLGSNEVAALAVRAAVETVPKSAGAAARFMVSLVLGADAAPADEKHFIVAVRQRLKAQGPAVRYSVDVERGAEGSGDQERGRGSQEARYRRIALKASSELTTLESPLLACLRAGG